MIESTRAVRSWIGVLAVVALAVWLPACHHGSTAVTTDPGSPVYRNPGADLTQVKGLAVHFVSVTTSNNEGVDLVHDVFMENIKADLGGRFGPITEGDKAPAGGGLLDVSLRVNWGNRAARIIVSMGAGRAGIEIDYDMKDAGNGLLAKMHVADSMSGYGSVAGGDAKGLVYSAASKWNRYFADEVLR